MSTEFKEFGSGLIELHHKGGKVASAHRSAFREGCWIVDVPMLGYVWAGDSYSAKKMMLRMTGLDAPTTPQTTSSSPGRLSSE